MRNYTRLTFKCGACDGMMVWNFSDDLWHCFGCGAGGPTVMLARKMIDEGWPGLELDDPSFVRPKHMGPPGYRLPHEA